MSDFRPSASLETLRRRGRLLQQAREFFYQRGYWEAQTPLLSRDTCVDRHIEPVQVTLDGETRFLQTSPEFGMKRLLASGSGSIFQICPAFRSNERGLLHNPEFTLVEWYKVGAGYHELMNEVGELVTTLSGLPAPTRTTYRSAFQDAVGVDAFTADEAALWSQARQAGLASRPACRDDLLNFLWAHFVEPRLGSPSPEFIFDYPAGQSALARTRREDDVHVAERFELYVQGIELANGFGELTNPNVLRERFAGENQKRASASLCQLPIESKLLDAMQAGLPVCSGVALGFDRLVMLALRLQSIDEVIAFPEERA